MSPPIRTRKYLYDHISILSDLVLQTKSSPTTNRISSVDLLKSLGAEASRYSVSMAILPHTVYYQSPANDPGLP